MSIVKQNFGEFPRKLDGIKYPRDNYPFEEALKYFDGIINEASRLTKDFTDPQVVYNEIESYHWSLLKLKKDLVSFVKAKHDGHEPTAVTLSKRISIIYFEAPMIFDDTNSNFPSKDRFVAQHSNSYVESRFTHVFYITRKLLEEVNLEKDDENLIKERYLALLRAFIDVCHPNVASDIISGMKELSDIYSHEIITNLLDSLVIRYGMLITCYGNNIYDDDKREENPFTILANSTCVDIIGILKGTSNYLDTVFGNTGAYTDSQIKKMFTDMVLNSIGYDVYSSGDKKRRDLFIEILRTVRQAITAWIKADADRTPTIPVFDILDMPRFIDFVYRVGLGIGKIDEPIQAFDDKIEAIISKKKELEKTDPDSIEIEILDEKLKKEQANRFEYLQNKSLIAFLLQEIVSNEKVLYQAMDIDTVFDIIINRPASEDNAMYDVWHVVMSTFVKRDDTPHKVESPNPNYIHYLEGDISSPEAFYLSSLLAGCMHHQMPSFVAAAPIYDFETFEIAIRSVSDTMSRTNEVINTEIFRSLYNIKYYIEHYVFSSRIDPESKEEKVDFETLQIKEHTLNEAEKKECIECFKKMYMDIGNTIENIFGAKISPPSSVFVLSDDTKKMLESIVNDIKDFSDSSKKHFGTIIDSLDSYICETYSALNELERNKRTFDKIMSRFSSINSNINANDMVTGTWNRVIESDNEYPKNLWPYSQSYHYNDPANAEEQKVLTEDELDEQYMVNLTTDKVLKGEYSKPEKQLESRFTRSDPD